MPIRRALTWHRPMMVFAGVMAGMAVVSAVGLAVDDRVLLGAPVWLKPFKFAVSMALYCVTWAWLVSLLRTHKRLAAGVSTVLVTFLAVEYAIIALQAARGRASHFNTSTEFDANLGRVMGGSIVVLWVGTLALTVLLLRTPIADAASRLAIRLGSAISLVGLALGALMFLPASGRTVEGVIGAHSVGVPDGGPGMPVTGWSTTGGDLRIPHFIGMHALQLLPLLALLLGALATRLRVLTDGAVRARLVLVAAAGYAGLVALVTWQALRGQPLLAPDAWTLVAAGLLAFGVATGVADALRRAPVQEHAGHEEVGVR
nr:hypothetical protein [Amycolatopsis aidingensis]